MRKTRAGKRNDALRDGAPRHLLRSSSEAFHKIWSLSMSVLFTHTLSFPPVQAADPAAPVHQSSSGRWSRPVRRRGWWSWLDRIDERIALRDIAGNPHLLRDIGLTRHEALHE